MTSILVVGAYAVVAGLAWSRASVAKRVKDSRRERRMLAVSLLFLVLALSYQLEFIPQAIALAKALAKHSGWYAYRWPLAGLGVMTIIAAVGFLLARYRPNLRGQPLSSWLIGLGGALLAGYFLLRGTSLHWVDPWSGIHFGCPRTNPWIEFISTLCLGVGLWFTRARRQTVQSDPVQTSKYSKPSMDEPGPRTVQSNTCCGCDMPLYTARASSTLIWIRHSGPVSPRIFSAINALAGCRILQ
ncbi:MAG: hypothetical protein JWM68_3153 [Verrucomicrobiales bacterium]|nr:hypothetical protein [Verrucomicrobiales bacterium]